MLGENIKILRKQKGYSQNTLAVLNEHMVKQSRFRRRVLKTLLIIFVLVPAIAIFLTLISLTRTV